MSEENQIEEKHELSESIYMSGHGLDWKDSDDIAEQLYHEGYRKQTEGKWITKGDFFHVFACSICNSTVDFPFQRTFYCPNCGAKMKGGAE